MTLSWLDDRLWFPDPKRASPEGFVAVGGDMTVDRLLLAYRSGIFPWTDDPITWWSPDPRGIFELDQVHVSRSLAHVLKRGVFQVTFDVAFEQVIRGCSEVPRQDQNTWISPYFIEAYTDLHRAGWAHSVEVWQDGELAGGLYGVSIGGFFAGESMFHRVSNASKVAVVSLAARMKERGMTLFDTQMVTPATAQLGAVEIPRTEYLKRIAAATAMHVTFI
jgi:leucyl/phenylalanyl-tRNA--protein transferase